MENCLENNQCSPKKEDIGHEVSEKPSSSYNPSVSDDVREEDLEKVKGDAIGDTLYSERFVLSTLLKLTKIEEDLSNNEEFEKDLCTLWDMTIEKDVVRLLLSHNVLELFSGIISVTEDKRLTEILMGIIANMCNMSDTRDELCINDEVMAPIMDLISCSDSLTLIQLMRLFHAALVFENSGDEMMWFQHFKNCDNFVDHFAFILVNSNSNELLISSFEALHAICAKFAIIEIQPGVNDLCFRDVFVQPSLVAGVIEAFKTMLPERMSKKSDDDTCTPTQNSQRIMNLFLDINVILSQYETVSRKCYEPVLEDLSKCVSQILSPLCQPIYLLPLTSNEQGVVENISEIFQAIGDPFDEFCFAQMITIWNLIDRDRESKGSVSPKWEDDEDADEEVNPDDICMTLLEFLTRTVQQATDDELKNSLQLHNPNTILKILTALNAGDSEPDIKDCCIKMQRVFESINIKEAKIQQKTESETEQQTQKNFIQTS